MALADPSETHRLFQHDRVAAGYASARPYLHPEVFAHVRELIGSRERSERALDVGCGTGMSSRALLDLARMVVGLDGSLEMLRRVRGTNGVSRVAALAESLPFRARAFDLVVACGSIDWVDRSRFLPRAAELLGGGGWLVSLDFGDTGRSPEWPGLARWYDEVFQRRHPRPASQDPMLSAAEAAAHGFSEPIQRDFSFECSFSAEGYADFLMTESNLIAAVEYGGQAPGPLRARLVSELEPLFGGGPRRVTFAGYIQALRKRS